MKYLELKKKAIQWRGGFCGWFFPTESPRDSKRQLRTVIWPVHRLKCRWNYRGIQNGKSVRWRVLFAVRIADGLTDGIRPSVKPSEKVNICPLYRPSPPLFLLLPHPNSSQLQTTSPPKKKSPSSQHNKLYFLKFCGHNICVLIYRWILSIFISNSIFLNFNI